MNSIKNKFLVSFSLILGIALQGCGGGGGGESTSSSSSTEDASARVVPGGSGGVRIIPTTGSSATATYYALTVKLAGTGSGTVTSDIAGISCGADCSETYISSVGNIVLTAAAASGSTFAGWSGACTGTTATCTVKMSQAREAIATFNVPVTASYGTTYHVRTDGSTADKCTGKADAAYPGTGTNQACAWNSPFVALPPGGTARIAGGDTLVIHTGQYKIGYGAPGLTTNSTCHSAAPWDCVLLPVPSGPDAARPTRIVGQGYDTGCAAPPQLWGAERAAQVLSLANANNVKVACLEITDHVGCAENHTGGLACNRSSFPYGDWAGTGIYANKSDNVQINDVNVHGLGSQGMLVGGISNWTLTNVKIVGNGSVGWNGDLAGRGVNSSNSGTIKFSRVNIEWNGCAETYPGNAPAGCWGQSVGGYGDGLGTARTGGNWIFEDTVFKHNVSDGLDLLYADGTGSVTVNRVWSEGNASNQIKIAGPSSVTNLVAIGDCGYFDGKSFTYNVDPCRAVGDTVVLQALSTGQKVSLINSTVIGQGNVIANISGPSGSSATLANNVLVGWAYYYDRSVQAADVYISNGISVSESYTTKQGLRNTNCSGTAVVCGSAGLTSTTLGTADVKLSSTSTARNTGLGVGGLSGAIPAVDFYGAARPAGGGVDRGAIEAQ